ncbi:hypothetical protein HK405_014459 [Cladochytrium tenue]|nr:hypothetical protein HK405_014459 [Cladochytrium tenue]
MLSGQAYREIMMQFGDRIVPPTHPYSQFVQRAARNIVKVPFDHAISGVTDLEWEVHVIDHPQRNAFVLPGGKMFVFTGILPVVGDKEQRGGMRSRTRSRVILPRR